MLVLPALGPHVDPPICMPQTPCPVPRAARPTSVGSSTLTPIPPSAHSLKKGSMMATAAPLGSAAAAACRPASPVNLAGSILYTYSCKGGRCTISGDLFRDFVSGEAVEGGSRGAAGSQARNEPCVTLLHTGCSVSIRHTSNNTV